VTRAFVLAAAWWDADVGPPRAELLPRAERLAASFATRILTHVLALLAERSAVPLQDLPWVLGVPDAPHEPPPGPELRRALAPTCGLGLVHAGPATVAMALLEALGCLVEHEAALVAFAHDATPPHHHEALAVALLLARAPTDAASLVLAPPALRRTSSHFTRFESTQPFAAARALARAAHVGRPTVETVPSTRAERPDHWRIELSRAF
jgi:hypothetical protein